MPEKELIKQIKQEIEKQIEEGKVKCQQSQESNDYESFVAWSEHVATCGKLLVFINSLSEEPLGDDLEEAAKQHSKQAFNGLLIEDNIDAFVAGADWKEQRMKEALQTEYEKGRFDMREEMMKDAVETTVHNCEVDGIMIDTVEIFSDGLTLDDKIYKDGDKVKIIIAKEEQQ